MEMGRGMAIEFPRIRNPPISTVWGYAVVVPGGTDEPRYGRAARKDDALAQNNYALLLEDEGDTEAAKEWLRKASAFRSIDSVPPHR